MSDSRNTYHSIPARDILNMADIPRWEYHVHTHYTDGIHSVPQLVEHAISIGIERMVFTEHTEPWQAKDPGWFGKYLDDINKARDLHCDRIELFVGIEAPAIDFNGGLEATDEMMDKAEFILGAAHRYPELGSRRVRDLTPEEALEMELKTLHSLIESPYVDCIAHIGATCSKYCGPFPLDLTNEVVESAVRNGKSIEINHRYHTPLIDYLKVCMDHDARIVPGSNAHKMDNVGDVVSALERLKSEFKKD